MPEVLTSDASGWFALTADWCLIYHVWPWFAFFIVWHYTGYLSKGGRWLELVGGGR